MSLLPAKNDIAIRVTLSPSQGDIDQCVSLWLSAVENRDNRAPASGTSARVAAKFAIGDQRLVVVERFNIASTRKQIRGFALTTFRADGVAYLELLATHSRHQGIGLGRQLTEDALWAAAERGLTRFELDVRTGNVAAIRLYESVGMKITGLATPHPLGGEPMVTMTRILNASS
jgi:ribosomal protein S18 acetylase RimI-like enzyme